MNFAGLHRLKHAALWAALTIVGGAGLGCAGSHRKDDQHLPPPRTIVVVVAPVVNLSGSEDFDSLKVTDLIASEFLSFRGVAVIPVNLVLAELARQGKHITESPQDALELARTFHADATVVTAVTEYRPYDPPVVGLVMQWYAPAGGPGGTALDPVAASRSGGGRSAELSDAIAAGPTLQLQRVFNAADTQLLDEIRKFAERRSGDQSPYSWRKYTKSQELYVRYCGWAMIRTMLALNGGDPAADGSDEARS